VEIVSSPESSQLKIRGWPLQNKVPNRSLTHHQPRKNCPKGPRGRQLQNRFPNRVLLRMSWRGPKQRKLKRPSLNFKICSNPLKVCGAGKSCESGVLSRTGLGGVLGEAQSPMLAGLVYKHPDGVFCTGFG